MKIPSQIIVFILTFVLAILTGFVLIPLLKKTQF